MKRYDNLYSRICSMDNLVAAEKKARKGKEKSYGVRMFDRNAEANLAELHDALVRCDYHTSEYTTFTIFEPKERLIFRLPYYPDRIVHHAVMNVLEPIWVSLFISHTYSCIKGRGIHRAVNDLKRDLRRDIPGTRYCLKIDIRHFYPTIDHEVLKAIVRKKLKDGRLLKLLDEIIDSADGVPIGNYLSQYFANLYLTYFDHYVKEELGVRYYYRYADDIVLLSDDKGKLRGIFGQMQRYIAERLKLEVKGNWQIFPVEARGIDFLGYVFRHTYTRLRKCIKKNICRRVARFAKIEEGLKRRRIRIGSYFGWLKYCNSAMLKHKLNLTYGYEVFV